MNDDCRHSLSLKLKKVRFRNQDKIRFQQKELSLVKVIITPYLGNLFSEGSVPSLRDASANSTSAASHMTSQSFIKRLGR